MTITYLRNKERKKLLSKIIFPFFISFLFLVACSNQAEVEQEPVEEDTVQEEQTINPISAEEAENLNITDYFPKESGTIREYEVLDQFGNVLIKDYEVINSFGSTEFISPEELGEFVILRSSEVYESTLSVRESSDSIELKDNRLVRLAGGTDSNLETIEEDELVLTNSSSWEMKSNITRTITATEVTIQIEAEEFSNCIETIDTSSEDEQYQMKSYFAPGKGLVLEQKQQENNSGYFTQKKMVNFQLPEAEDTSANEGIPEEQEDEEEPSTNIVDTFVYHNEEYGFYLDLPVSWRGHYLVEETENMKDRTINFRFKSGENLYIDTILYIVVTDKTEEQIAQENEESGFPLTYLTSHNEKSYAYLYNVGDPSIELINSESDLELLIKLKQQVPEVMETLRFQP